MARFSEPDFIVKSLVGAGLAVCVVMFLIFWQLRSEERAAKKAVLPQCVAQLGSERACEDRFAQHHEECYRYTHVVRSRYSQRSFDDKGYLECIVAGPEAWLAARREARTRSERDQRADGVIVP